MMDAEKELRKFLNEICIDFGFCLLPNDIERLVSKKCIEADEFVREIFLAEEMNPDLELKLFRQIKNKFTDRFGAEIGCG